MTLTREEGEARLAKWLAWMRDPNTKQTREVLKAADGGMCCLAGICELSGMGSWGPSPFHDDYSHKEVFFFSAGEEEEQHYPPTSVVEWIGLRDQRGFFGPGNVVGAPHGMEYLDELNDKAHWTLPQIADFVEKNKAHIFTWALP